MADKMQCKYLLYVPTVIAIQILSTFCTGQAVPPGEVKKEIKEIIKDKIKGIAILFSNRVSTILFFLSVFSELFSRIENKFENAYCISDFENNGIQPHSKIKKTTI